MTSWQNKLVLITGGSSGLGLHLARAWGAAGAEVILVARDREKLTLAAELMTAKRYRVHVQARDITQPEEVVALAEWVNSEFGRLDVLVNAAGKSDRGRASEVSLQTYEELWRLNFLATVHCTQLFLPLLKKSVGHIVNIGSLAAKTAGPFLGAYPSSKFPVAAFSQQLRVELDEDRQPRQRRPPNVLLVCPGPIARDDAGSRYDEKSTDLPESARKPGGGAGVKAIDPVQLAAQILRACERRQCELVVPAKSRLLFVLQSLVPSWGDWLLKRVMSGKTSV